MEESEGNKEVYHINCEGVPLGTYSSQEEAENDMDKFKEMHPGKELIIEKGVYESHDDMLDKLDEMNDQLEETNDMENTEMQPEEGNAFSGALAAAKLKGDKEFNVGDKEYEYEAVMLVVLVNSLVILVQLCVVPFLTKNPGDPITPPLRPQRAPDIANVV